VKRYLMMLLGVAGIVAADQAAKYLTLAHIPLHGVVPVWDGVVHLTHLRNSGMAFSLFEGGRWVFLALTLAFLALAVTAAVRDWLPHPVGRTALVFLAGGAVGNLIDRLLYGSVVDMIEVDLIQFAVFNVADIFVTIGAALLLIWGLFLDRNKKDVPKDSGTSEEDGA